MTIQIEGFNAAQTRPNPAAMRPATGGLGTFAEDAVGMGGAPAGASGFSALFAQRVLEDSLGTSATTDPASVEPGDSADVRAEAAMRADEALASLLLTAAAPKEPGLTDAETAKAEPDPAALIDSIVPSHPMIPVAPPPVTAQEPALEPARPAPGSFAPPPRSDAARPATLAVDVRAPAANESTGSALPADAATLAPPARAPAAPETGPVRALLAGAQDGPAAIAPAAEPPATSASSQPLAAREASAPARADSAPPNSGIRQPVGDREWPREFASRVAWSASNGVQNAEIRITPAELGPVRVHIEIVNGTTNITFSAVQPETRGAIQDAMPVLRELLAASGGQADGASIGFSFADRDAPRGGDRRAFGGTAAAADESDPASAGHPTPRRGAGLVDTYA